MPPNLDVFLSKVHHLVFFSSGQCFIFDKEGNQITELQVPFLNGEINIPLLKVIAENAEKFTLAKFREWKQDLDKEDFFRFTNLNCFQA